MLERLELEMSQFEEMEAVLEEERRALAAQRAALANERANMRRTLESVRAEIAKNGGVMPTAGQAGVAVTTALAQAAQPQGTKVSPVEGGVAVDSEAGPSAEGNFQQIG